MAKNDGKDPHNKKPDTTTGSTIVNTSKNRKVTNGMTYKATITTKTGVYVQASASSKKKTTYKKGEKVTVTNIKRDSEGNTWGKTDKGWFMIIKSTGKEFCDLKATYKDVDGTKKTVDVTSNAAYYAELKQGLAEETVEEVGGNLNKTMQLFGLPYQFLPSVDYRSPELSNLVGRKYIENFIIDAPVVTILPGKPSFLPGASKEDKQSITAAFLQASAGNLGVLKDLANQTNIDNMKFYDFKTAYVEYMRYVNIMCRSMAAFLELDNNPNDIQYCINGEPVDFLSFDWKDYRWDGHPYASSMGRALGAAADAVGAKAKSAASTVWNTILSFGGEFLKVVSGESTVSNTYSGVKKKITGKVKKKIEKGHVNLTDNTSNMSEKEESTIESMLRNVHYVQFYCDPSSNSSESITNETKTSQLKSAFDGISEQIKDIAFMANTGGEHLRENLEQLGEGLLKGIDSIVGGAAGAVNGGVGTLINRITKTGTNVVKGDNVIMPDIYANSKYTKSYQIIVPLRALYGNKTSIYMDVLVPQAHLLALALPKATTANTFAAPMLVKVFMPGKFTCNMGIVTDLSIEYNDESRNTDGLATEIKVTLSITDLYSDLTMTPASDPVLFVNNSSLVEYLAINCGLDLIDNQYSTKVNLLFSNVGNAVKDIKDNVFSTVTEQIDDIIYGLTGL